jgi:multiple sugar transport system ATP-binding protein
VAHVRLVDIGKSYGKRDRVIDGLHLEVHDGELLVLVGPSGCGKSTILRMIAGLEEVSTGEISIDDTVVNNTPPKDRDVAMIFQDFALYPHMTVRDNIAFGLKMRRVPKTEMEERVTSTARTLGIESLLGRKPGNISGGERQRVALGRALVRNPKVFLMDEPLSNLDAKLRVQMRTEIHRLHRRLRATFVYVTHDQVEAMTMGSRIVVLNDGVVQQIDEPKRVYETPANAFVASFIGTPPMNLVRGTLESVPPGIQLRCERGVLRLPPTALRGSQLDDFVDREVIVGVRPEDVKLGAAHGLPEGMAGEIEFIEHTGAESYASVATSCATWTVRLAETAHAHPGQQVHLEMNADRIHFFACTGSQERLF